MSDHSFVYACMPTLQVEAEVEVVDGAEEEVAAAAAAAAALPTLPPCSPWPLGAAALLRRLLQRRVRPLALFPVQPRQVLELELEQALEPELELEQALEPELKPE